MGRKKTRDYQRYCLVRRTQTPRHPRANKKENHGSCSSLTALIKQRRRYICITESWDFSRLRPLFPLSAKKKRAEGSPCPPSRNAFTLCKAPSLLPNALMFCEVTLGNECATLRVAILTKYKNKRCWDNGRTRGAGLLGLIL